MPVVEPEILLDGDHTIECCFEATEAMLSALFAALREQNVAFEHTILKASMVLSGKGCPQRAGVEQVAKETVRCLKHTVPAALPGVVFLSGGQSDLDATAHLNAMAQLRGLPWPLSFSYSRALQKPALKAWRGSSGNIAASQQAFHHRAHMNSLATQGEYRPDLEAQAA